MTTDFNTTDRCANCKHCKPIENWDYSKVKTGDWKHKLNGYACTVFDETVIWMTGCDAEKGMCELWGERGEQE